MSEPKFVQWLRRVDEQCGPGSADRANFPLWTGGVNAHATLVDPEPPWRRLAARCDPARLEGLLADAVSGGANAVDSATVSLIIDVDYDFETDTFSSAERRLRHEEHSITLMRPHRL